MARRVAVRGTAPRGRAAVRGTAPRGRAAVRDAPRPEGSAEPSDRALVLAFQAGDLSAYDEIYRRYRPLAWRICRRMLGNPEDADEALQETMLRVFQGLPTFNGRYLLKAWVARIATNVCLDMLRARARRPENGLLVEDLLDASTGGGPNGDSGNGHRAHPNGNGHNGHDLDLSEVIERQAEAEAVAKTLQAIPAHHRAALVLREFEGLSHQEIGRALGITAPQAKSLIHRAKRSFRRAWERTASGRGAALLLPFLWPVHVLRRLFHRAVVLPADAASAAAAAVPAAPAVQATVTTAVERVVATVLVAGSIGLGVVATTAKEPPQPARPARALRQQPQVPAVPPVVEPPRLLAQPEPKEEPAPKPRKKRRALRPEGAPEAVPAPSPAPTEGEEAAPDPATKPKPAPTQPAPPPQPPTFGLALAAPGLGSDCDCQVLSELRFAQVEGKAGQELVVRQASTASGRDGKGERWSAFVESQAETVGATGTIQMTLYLKAADGTWYPLAALGTVEAVTEAEDGTTVYTFRGTYTLLRNPLPTDELPATGAFAARFVFWTDGVTLQHADVSLSAA